MRLKIRLSLLALTFVIVGGPTSLSAQNAADSHQFLVARMAAQNGDLERSLEILDHLLEADPGNAVLLFERASVYVSQRRMNKGLEDLEAAVAIDPEFYDARRLLGRILLDRSRGEQEGVRAATVHLEKAWRLHPEDLATGLMVSQLLMNLGDEQRAEEIGQTLVEDAPDNRSINYHYAQILTKVGRGNESVQYLERVVAQDSTYRPAVFQLVEIYQQQGEWQKAAEVIGPIIDQDPLDLELQRRQGFFFLRAGMSDEARMRFEALLEVDQGDAESRFYLAEALNDLGLQEDAEPILSDLYKKSPGDPELLISYGLNQIVLRQFDKAEELFRLLLDRKDLPPNVVALAETQLAAIDHHRGNYDKALARSVKVVTESIRFNGQALNIALDVFRRQERFGEAVTLLEMLMNRYSENSVVAGRYVEFLYRAGKDAAARRVIDERIERGLEDSLAVTQALSTVERYEDAVEILQILTAKFPDEIDIIFQLGAMFERSGRHEESEREFVRLLERNPDHAPSLNYLGYMWAERGENLEKAEEMISRAVDQFPRNGAYVDSLGWVYFRLGKYDLARKHLIDAVRLFPDDATVQEHLGDVLVKTGEIDRALEVYRIVLTLGPDDADGVKVKIHDLEKKIAEKTFKE